MKKKILHVVSGDLWGGAEAQVLYQSAALQDRGFEIHVLLFNDSLAHLNYQQAGLRCHFASESGGIFNLFATSRKITYAVAPDVVIAHGYKESFAALACTFGTRLPWISTFHGSTENYRGWKNAKMAIYFALYKFISRHVASHIICVSQELAEKLSFERLDNLSIVYNCVPANRQDLSECPFRNRPAIAAAGRLVPIKRIDRALRVLDRLNADRRKHELLEAHLYLFGEGPEKKNLEQLAAKLGLDGFVHFLGFQNDAPQQLAAADAVLLTSDSEGIPTVVLEALSHGVPVVATEVGGLREVKQMVSTSLLRLVDRENEAELASQIARVLELTPSREEKSAVRELLNKYFSPDSAANSIQRVVDNLSKS